MIWKPVSNWRLSFALLPNFTADGKFIWLRWFCYRWLHDGHKKVLQTGSIKWVESQEWEDVNTGLMANFLTSIKSPLRSRRWGPFRQEWYSVCSAHMGYKEGCKSCEAGDWVNVHKAKASSLFYKLSPKLWRIWANRKNSSFNKFTKTETFKKAFPNFRGK